MRTLVISDLHLGNGGKYDAFAGEEELPLFLDRFAREPTHVFVNGDGLDFLMNEDPLEMDRARAVQQARALVDSRATAGVLRAFGRVLARGGAVTIRLGNHDLELSLPEVQEVVRAALDQPEEVAARLEFQLGDKPKILEVGGARILVTHGEHDDRWNKVEYDQLAKPETYRYTAGSTLVKQIMNLLTRAYDFRFASFLKPDMSGGALTALAVNPGIVKEVFKTKTAGAAASIITQLLARLAMAAAFTEKEQDHLGIATRLGDAELDDGEMQDLEDLLNDQASGSFADGDKPSPLQVKLARAGLKLYAGIQRSTARSEGADTFFELTPGEAEWADAQRLAKEKENDAGAVIFGHTHAARWRAEPDGIVFANTGTWIWLMKLPSTDASFDTWANFLEELKKNPMLEPAKQKLATTLSRFTATILEPHVEGGADMSLVEWKNEKLVELGRARVPPTPARANDHE